MDGAKGTALEWALALLRAPAERHALRQKPLPEGIHRLLGIAAGAMPEALAEACQAFGESEARLREAAQFYAREVLFHVHADAYRTLGVTSDASPEQIKANHRLLQHWLHPDRLQGDDDEVFAARVNSAWNQLRTPDRRAAYDAAQRDAARQEPGQAADGMRGMQAWVPEPVPAPTRWRHRLPVLGLTAACGLLVLLVVRDLDRKPDRWEWSEPRSPETASLDPSPPPQAASGPAPRPPSAKAPRAAVAKASSQKAPAPEARRPVAVVGMQAARAPNAVRKPLPAKPRPEPLARTIQIATGTTGGRASPATKIATSAPATAGTAPASGRIEVAAPVGDAQTARTAGQGADARRAPPNAVAAVAAAPATRAPQAPVHGAAEALPSYARLQAARKAGDLFLRYMGAADRPAPPIWNSPSIQSSAASMRRDLHGRGRMQLSAADWRIGSTTAVLTSGVRAQGGSAGVLTADMVWREGRWLITGVSVERAR